jgi:hypothetical protein
VQKIGKVTATYDPPISHVLPFPFGFLHDLSLVTDNALPRMIRPSGIPRIVGWGNYNEVLDSHSVFVIGFNLSTGNPRHSVGTGVSRNAHQAIAEGPEYLWDKHSCSQSISILWRTTHNGDSLQGLSGATLCLGRPDDETCFAVCFQNFEAPLRSQHLVNDYRGPPGDSVARSTLKGGSLLSPEIRSSEIICDEGEISIAYRTYQGRKWSSAETPERRTFSSHM